MQDFVKKWHEDENNYKRLVFLTSSQSAPEMLNNYSENTSMTSSSDGCCNDTSDRSVPSDSILTDDLQLNWSAFTPNRTEKLKEKIHQKVRKLFISYESNGVKPLCDIFHTRCLSTNDLSVVLRSLSKR